MGGVGRNRGRLAQAQHGSGVHGAGGGQRLASLVPSLSHPTSQPVTAQRPLLRGAAPPLGTGSQETCSRVLGFSSSSNLGECREGETLQLPGKQFCGSPLHPG